MALTAHDLQIQIEAETRKADASIERFNKSLLRTEGQLRRAQLAAAQLDNELDDNLTKSVEANHRAMEQAGRGLIAFGAAAGVGLGLAAREAVKWESAWAGVTKTVDGSAKQMAGLEDRLRQMARTLPASHEEIAAVAEAAGQLGVKTPAIAGFTKVMIDLGETTNLTAQDAATALARFSNIMGTSQGDVDRLGSTIVELGNNTATTEAEIVEMGSRLAAAGKQAGLSESDVLSFAATLTSVGVNAEAGGTALSKVFTTIGDAVRDGGEELDVFAQVAGMSTQQFATAFNRDAAGAINSWVQGMGRMADSGQSTSKVFDALSLTDQRLMRAILSTAQAGDLLNETVGLGNKAWKDNSALIEEANKRYQTTESKVKIARNQIADFGITVGQTVLPPLAAAAKFVGNLVTAFDGLPGPLKSLVGPLTAVMGAASLMGGAMLLAVPKIHAFNTAVAAMGAGKMKTAGLAVQRVSSLLMGPLGVGLTVVAGLTAHFASKQGEAAQMADALKATLDEQTGALTESSDEWARNELVASGAASAAKRLGIDLGMLHEAGLKPGGEAAKELNARLAELEENATGSGNAAGLAMQTVNKDAHTLRDTLGGLHGAVREGTTDWQLSAEMQDKAGDASGRAGGKAKGFAGAVADGADAAGDLTEEAKTLGEEMRDLSENFLDQREAGRAVRDTLRQIRERIREYRKEQGDLRGAFNKGTESGDEFAGMLDDLAGNYQDQIDAVQRVTGSEKKARQAYRESRKDLIQTAKQLGMSQEAAERYTDKVLNIPSDAKTEAKFEKRQAERDVQAWRASTIRALNSIPNEDVKVQLTGLAKLALEGAGPLMRATGGPIHGPGTATSDSIPALLSNGEHVLTADEVKRAGGHDGVFAIRRMLQRGEFAKRGDVPAFAQGGPVTGSATVIPNVSSAGMSSAMATISAAFSGIADRLGDRLSAKINEALKFGGGRPLGPGGSLSAGQVMMGQKFAQAEAGKPYLWGGVGPGGYDCSGYPSAVLNKALGRYPHSRLGSTGTMPWSGFSSGLGSFSIGWFTGDPGHMAANIGGLPFESAGGAGTRTGGAAASVTSFPRVAKYDEGGIWPNNTLGVNTSGGDEIVINPRKFAKGGKVTKTDRRRARRAARGRFEPQDTGREMQSELRDLIEALRENLGKKSPLIERVDKLGGRMVDMGQRMAKLDRTSERLANRRENLIGKRNDLRSSVADQFRTDPFGGSLDEFSLQVRANRNDARRHRRALQKARKKGLSGPLFRELAQSGNFNLAQEFAGSSGREIRRFERIFSQRNRASRHAGGFVAQQTFGGDLQRNAKATQRLERSMRKLDRRMDKLDNRIEGAVFRGTRAGNRTGGATKKARA